MFVNSFLLAIHIHQIARETYLAETSISLRHISKVSPQDLYSRNKLAVLAVFVSTEAMRIALLPASKVNSKTPLSGAITLSCENNVKFAIHIKC